VEFDFSQELSDDVLEKSQIITAMSSKLKNHFSNKSFGPGLESITVGIICVRKEFDFFFKPRKKHLKSKKMLEYDIKLDHEKFSKASQPEIEAMVEIELLRSLEGLAIKDFNLNEFTKELKDYFTG